MLNYSIASRDNQLFKWDWRVTKNWTICSIKKWDRFLEKPFYPHALRHYTCTHLAKLGASSELIVEIFKWSSVDMVSIYNDISAKEREWKELDKLKDGLIKKE